MGNYRININAIMSKQIKNILLVFLLFIGVSETFAQNGVDSQGKKHGPWKVTIQGVKAFEGNFNHGLKEGSFKTYYPGSGKLQNSNNFKSDKMNGIQKAFAENGNLLWESTYANGVKIGKEIKYHINGKKKAELNYNNSGELIGNAVVYDEQGNKLDQQITVGSSNKTISKK